MTPTGTNGFQAGEIIDVHCNWGGGAASLTHGWEDADRVRETLEARRVRWAFVVSEAARHFDPIAGNEETDALTRAQPGLRGWFVANPARVQDAHAQMRRLLYNERWVGCALYPDPLRGRPVTFEDFDDIVNAYRRFGKPLYIATPDADAARHAARIARELSPMRVILGGMGGDDWREATDLCINSPGLFLDISGALAPEKITYALHTLHGARKLLFASNAPHTDPAAVIGLLDDLDLSPEDRVRILGGSAARLFRFEETAPAGGPDLRPFGAAAGEPEPEENFPRLATLDLDEPAA